MPILAFNPEQLLMLSSAARTRPEPDSPLRPLYLQVPPRATPASQQVALAELAKAGMLLGDKRGRPRLPKALEPVLWALHRPERCVSLERFGRRDAAETFFCRVGKLWVQLAIAATEQLQVVSWPFDDAMMARWFAEDLLGDVAVGAGSGDEEQVALSLAEFAVLVALQEVYRRKVEASGPVKGSALWVARDALREPSVLDAVHRVTGAFVPRDRLGAAFGDAGALAAVADRLVATGLVAAHDDLLAWTGRARESFDPGRLQAVVAVTDWRTPVTAALLYVHSDGWLIVEPGATDPPTLTLHRVPGRVAARGVFERLLAAVAAPPPSAQ